MRRGAAAGAQRRPERWLALAHGGGYTAGNRGVKIKSYAGESSCADC